MITNPVPVHKKIKQSECAWIYMTLTRYAMLERLPNALKYHLVDVTLGHEMMNFMEI